MIPIGDYDIYQTYVYGQSLVNPKYYSSLGTQMFLLNKWYLIVTKNDEAAWLLTLATSHAASSFLIVTKNDEAAWLVAKVRPEHYLGYDVVHIEFNELHQLLHRDALNKSLVSCWCL